MPGTNILMRADYTGGVQNALAQIDIPLVGNLVGVAWSIYGDCDADGDLVVAELSFGSAYVNANDSRQVISVMVLYAIQVTAASALTCFSNGLDLMELGVTMGERLYLHVSATAGVTGAIHAMLHFDFDLDRPASRRR